MSSDPTPTDPIERAAQVRRVLNDPGAITPRLRPDGLYELVTDWQVRALSAAGLLAATPATDLDIATLAAACQAFVQACADHTVGESVLGSLAQRVAVAAGLASSPAPADDEAAQVERITRSALASETQAMASIAKAVGLAEDDDAEAIVYQVRELVAALAALRGQQT